MKTITVFLLLVAITVSGYAQDVIIPNNEIPVEIKSYIKTHFPTESISQATKDKEAFKIDYEIILSNLTDLEFNKKRQITDIDSKSKLPNSVIPGKILTYVTLNYPNSFIKSWKLDDNNQKIKLDNDLELKFSMNGTFIRLDD